MKNIYKIFLLLLTLSFSACEDDTNMVFEISNNNEALVIQTQLLGEYLISDETADNIAERLFWQPVDFGAPVNITYELYSSLNTDFSDSTLAGSTTETNIAITVDQLLDFADELELDDNPETTNEEGLPNNTGTVYFKLRAYVGSGNSEDLDKLSESIALTFRVLEKTSDSSCPSIWVVGAGAPDAGWDWVSPVEFTCNGGVYSARMRLANDNFRFFETEGVWESGLNWAYFIAEGYTIDEKLEEVQDGDNNFLFNGTPGIYDVVVDDNAKTITITAATNYYLVGDGTQAGWVWDNPVELIQVSPYIYEGSVTLNTAGAFRVFTIFNNWDSGRNFPYFEGEGYTIDDRFENAVDGDSNFKFTGAAGSFTITVNEIEKTITLE